MMRIVIVEDSVLLREGIARLLTESGTKWSASSSMPRCLFAPSTSCIPI